MKETYDLKNICTGKTGLLSLYVKIKNVIYEYKININH